MANFAQTPHVRAVHGDGGRVMFEPADVIYVNVNARRASFRDNAMASMSARWQSNRRRVMLAHLR
jgi:hypothetical protein